MLRATRQCHRSSRHILLIVLLKPSSYSRFSSCGEGKIKFIHNRRETFAESVRLVRVSVGSAENSRRRRKDEVRIKNYEIERAKDEGRGRHKGWTEKEDLGIKSPSSSSES